MTLERTMLNEHAVDCLLLDSNFVLVGSRSVLSDFLTGSAMTRLHETADFDFMGPVDPHHIVCLVNLGFVSCSPDLNAQLQSDEFDIDRFIGVKREAEYTDMATHSVWVIPEENRDPNFPNVQVSLKHPEHYNACVKMWKIFRANPSLFHDYFWKSNKRNPLIQSVVQDRIHAMFEFLAAITDDGTSAAILAKRAERAQKRRLLECEF